MKSLILLGMLVLVLAINVKGSVLSSADVSAKSRWEEFKRKYSKTYSAAEEKTRFVTFSKNLAYILQYNSEEQAGKLDINEFADMDEDEANRTLMGSKRPVGEDTTGAAYLSPEGLGELPETVDWRQSSYVTPVKNQNPNCGSCYAFSATGSLEGQHKRKTGLLVSLSEQNLVDCSGGYGNHGCKWGWMHNCFNYIKHNGGIDTESSYPYQHRDDLPCRFNRTNVGATVRGYVSPHHCTEQMLKEIVATVGPISVSIDARYRSFRFYSGGYVYMESSCSSVTINHSVLVVGYGRTADYIDYWLVKNSWGDDWGERGYIRMARNRNNMCAIASYAIYPLV